MTHLFFEMILERYGNYQACVTGASMSLLHLNPSLRAFVFRSLSPFLHSVSFVVCMLFATYVLMSSVPVSSVPVSSLPVSSSLVSNLSVPNTAKMPCGSLGFSCIPSPCIMVASLCAAPRNGEPALLFHSQRSVVCFIILSHWQAALAP